MDLLVELLAELIKRAMRGGLKQCLILLLGFNVACSSVAKEPESFPVGSAPWEIQERDARIAELELRVSVAEAYISEIREAAAQGFRTLINVVKRQEKINEILAGESNE